MVGLVRHSLLEGTISLDVDNVASLVTLQVRAQVFHALGFVSTREHVSRATPVAFRVRHGGAVRSPWVEEMGKIIAQTRRVQNWMWMPRFIRFLEDNFLFCIFLQRTKERII